MVTRLITKVADELARLPQFRPEAYWLFDDLKADIAKILQKRFPLLDEDRMLEDANAIAGLKPMVPVRDIPTLPSKIAAILAHGD